MPPRSIPNKGRLWAFIPSQSPSTQISLFVLSPLLQLCVPVSIHPPFIFMPFDVQEVGNSWPLVSGSHPELNLHLSYLYQMYPSTMRRDNNKKKAQYNRSRWKPLGISALIIHPFKTSASQVTARMWDEPNDLAGLLGCQVPLEECRWKSFLTCPLLQPSAHYMFQNKG